MFPHHLRRSDKSDFNDLLGTDGKDAVANRIRTVLVGPYKATNALPVDDARQNLATAITASIDELHQSIGATLQIKLKTVPAFSIPIDPPQIALRIDLGLGKTEESIKAAVEWVRRDIGDVVYAIPRHDLSDELVERFRKKATDLRIEIWRGCGAGTMSSLFRSSVLRSSRS